jgi:PPE-SVP subfamily C-terminal region
LASFATPSQNTNPGGVGDQAAAVGQASGTGGLAQLLSNVPQTLQHLASAGSSGGASQMLVNLANSAPVQGLGALETALNPYGFFVRFISPSLLNAFFPFTPVVGAFEQGGFAAAGHVAAVSGGAPSASWADSYRSGVGGAGVGGAGVSAGLGRAALVGGLSVPQSWATASPAVRLAATALPADGLGAWAGSAAPGGMFNGMCPVGSVVNTSRNSESRSRADSGLKVIPQMPGGQNTPGRRVNPDQHAAHNASSLSASALSERDELNDLRTAIAALAKERDVLKRSADRFIEKAKKAMQR